MANTIFLAPTANFTQTTLNGAITSGAGTITLNSVTGIQAPGYIVVDRTDSNGLSTPNSREVISYTGVSGNQLTGCTRGADGSTARAHNDAAVVETMPTVGMWNSLATIVGAALDGNGLLNPIASTASIAKIQASNLYASQASLAVVGISSRIDVSGASVTGPGLGLYPTFVGKGSYSGPTTGVGSFLVTPRAATLQWVSILTRFAVSTASIGFDLQKNGVSIFSNATSRPAIPAGGTYVSTASINTRNVDAGNLLVATVDSVGTNGIVTDIVIQGGAY